MKTRLFFPAIIVAINILLNFSAESGAYTQGSEFQVNTTTGNIQNFPSVASDGTDYLITWQSYGQDGNNYGIYGQFISGANGSNIGSEFQVNTYTTNEQIESSVASNGTDYLVTWESYVNSTRKYDTYGQLISCADGSKIGSQFLINSFTTNDQTEISVSSNVTDYLVTWESTNQDGDGLGIYGQFISALDGSKIGSEFLINSYTSYNQASPSVASNGMDYLVAWYSNYQDGSQDGVYATIFSQSGPVPEPVSFILLGCSVLGIFIRMKQKKSLINPDIIRELYESKQL